MLRCGQSTQVPTYSLNVDIRQLADSKIGFIHRRPSSTSLDFGVQIPTLKVLREPLEYKETRAFRGSNSSYTSNLQV